MLARSIILIHVLCKYNLNTLRAGQMAAISQTTIWNAFSWMKIYEFRLKFHRSLFLRVALTIFQHWLVKIMAWRRPGDKPLSEPMMVRLPTHICVSRPQWVNTCIVLYHTLKTQDTVKWFHLIYTHWYAWPVWISIAAMKLLYSFLFVQSQCNNNSIRDVVITDLQSTIS